MVKSKGSVPEEHAPPAADRNQAAAHLRTLFGRIERGLFLVISSKRPGDKSMYSAAYPIGQLDAAVEHAIERSAEGADVWVRQCPLRQPPPRGRRGRMEDSAVLPALWLDADLGKPEYPPDEAAVHEVLNRSGLPEPTLILHSGNGLQLIWVLANPPTTLEPIQRLLRRWKAAVLQRFLAAGYELDKGAFDAARILRVAGTVNYKGRHHKDHRGEPDKPVKLIECHPERLYSVEHIEQLCSDGGATEDNSVSPSLGSSVSPSLGLSVAPPSSAEEAIERTLPDREATRHRQLLELARALKAMPRYADAPAEELEPIVQQWHRRALPTIRTKEWEDNWDDFAEAWDEVQFPRGTGPIAEIAKRAVQAADPPEALRYKSRGHRDLVKLCRALQQHHRTEPFYLSCGMAAGLLGVDKGTASRRLRRLQRDGIIERVEEHTKTRARRYRYVESIESPSPDDASEGDSTWSTTSDT